MLGLNPHSDPARLQCLLNDPGYLSSHNFHELGNERDPIIGTQDGTLEYKIPKRPIRKKITGLLDSVTRDYSN
jgi:hypothetical protein